jgi:hypothetical protein
MARPSPLVVGTVILAPLILGLEIYVFHGSHHRAATAVVASAPETSAAPSLPSTSATIASTTARPEPAPSRSPANPVAATAEPTDAGGEDAYLRRRRLLADYRRQIMQAADEQTFQTLNLPDATRSAIRAIDDTYVRSLQTLQAPTAIAYGDGGLRPPDLSAEHTRQAAIGELLGPEAAREFTTTERRAERQLRNQIRPQSVPGL